MYCSVLAKLETTKLLGVWYNCFRRKHASKRKAIKERQLPVFFPELKRTLDVIYKLSTYIPYLSETTHLLSNS